MIVQTNYGKVSGTEEGNIYVYRGIPFAQPPIGERRFAPPSPPLPWDGVLQAEQFGPAACQPTPPDQMGREQSEDCLYLNVWTPGIDAELRPVLVDIHGGGFTGGTGADFKYVTFAERDDIVCVSLNYRLGALGFLYLGDLLGDAQRTSGNNGLLDIVAALKWVQENIRHFGGDPNRITVSGGSAGAKCASSLLAVPEAEGLFGQLIAQSGAMQAIRDTHTANQVALTLLDKLEIPHHEAHRLLDLPAQTIIAAQDNSLHTFGPVRDGVIIVAESNTEALANYENKLPILLGTNSDEAAFFIQFTPEMTAPDHDAIRSLFGENSDYVRSAYDRAALAKPFKEAWKDTLTECLYHTATVRLAEAASSLNWPVWLYRFNFSTGAGAVHSLESSFITDSESSSDDILFIVPPSGKELALRMHAAWASFIRTGRPAADGLPDWPAFTADERSLMFLDEECRLLSEPDNQHSSFPDQVFKL